MDLVKKMLIQLFTVFLIQIADFGLSKWRMMSLSQSRNSKSAPEGGTIIYMPPENYEPGQKSRASVKHDIYRYNVLVCSELTLPKKNIKLISKDFTALITLL